MAIWNEELYGTGRCVNCGFLSKRSPQFDEMCFHASKKDRISGVFSQHHTLLGGKTSLRDTIPWCFVGKADFLKELGGIKATVFTDKVLGVIERDRKCPSWYPWREFASPKEHFEESMMIAMEKRREKFEQQMEKDRKDFELKLEEINKRERRITNWVMIGLGVAAIIFAILEVLAAIIAGILGITTDSWILNWFR